MAAATTTPKKMSCGMQLLTHRNVVQVNAHVCQGKKQGVHCFPPFIVPPSGWRLTGFPLLLMILYQNNFLSAHFLHKLLFPLHVLQKFQKHFIFCCASHTKHLDLFCAPRPNTKMAGCLILDPQPSIQLFCGSSTRSVNHSFSQCSVIVPPRFSAAARTPRRSLPPWVLRRGRPSAPSSTSCAQ